jgi:hypothetical protein|tara:strand:+ start:1979 stop:2152 length:174 start_codon:yes stop_codon:yes gene_type:complete
MSRKLVFDKFIKDIVRREAMRQETDESKKLEETPQRRYRKLYAERWQNRVIWKKRGK